MPTNNMSDAEQMVNQDFARRMFDNLRAQQEKGEQDGFAEQTKPYDLHAELKQLEAELREGVNKK
jgi:HSP20 family molecular chaperone IbpA